MGTASDSTKLNDEKKVRSLYKMLLDSWNARNARDYSELFTEDALIIGFDGSQSVGRKEIYNHLHQIFNDHETASYVSIVKMVRSLDPNVWVLHSNVGMIQRGKSDINPALNAIQVLVAIKQQDDFLITIFQNTPAAFHGRRPELSEQLTKELRSAL
jgi:uncharacterized protein (TIGR02246 family)